VTFEQFAMARLPSLLRYAVVLTGDRELAQDVVQEVLARAQARWKRISETDVPEAYVRRMVLNEYLSWRRSWAVLMCTRSVNGSSTSTTPGVVCATTPKAS
jgi:DNA-directed RNA polymerase specialized sigma24 family protein